MEPVTEFTRYMGRRDGKVWYELVIRASSLDAAVAHALLSGMDALRWGSDAPSLYWVQGPYSL